LIQVSYARTGLPTATTANAVYNLANQLTSWNGSTLSYDNTGNMTSFGTQTYTWNARGQLTATSGGTASFAYDAVGRRSSKIVAGTTTKFLYDGANVVQEQDGTGLAVANEITGGLDQVFWRKETQGAAPSRNFLSDAAGSTIALLDGMGGTAATYTYEPYGKQTATIPAGEKNSFQFTGREWDGAPGLQFNRARYYSPSLARFITEDPVGFVGGTNPYAYVGDGPTYRSDPLGLVWSRSGGGGGEFLGGIKDVSFTIPAGGDCSFLGCMSVNLGAILNVVINAAIVALLIWAAPAAGVFAVAAWSQGPLIAATALSYASMLLTVGFGRNETDWLVAANSFFVPVLLFTAPGAGFVLSSFQLVYSVLRATGVLPTQGGAVGW
jgi:RHS repeat-associated protein